MGQSGSAPKPQVRERHVRAIYINVPVEPAMLSQLLIPPAVPDLFGGKAWISVVVDDLFKLQIPVGSSFATVPLLNGWMMKLNALVRCPVEKGGVPVSGYQILTIDFESGFGGGTKQRGAMDTQKIPSSLVNFDMSCGRSGYTDESSMEPGTRYSARVSSSSSDEILVQLDGHLAPLASPVAGVTEATRDFCGFVVERPHKFLAQGFTTQVDRHAAQGAPAEPARRKLCTPHAEEASLPKQQLAFASWQQGYNCSTDGCVQVVSEKLSLPLLDRLGVLLAVAAGRLTSELEGSESIRDCSSNAVCFLQPEYTMVDFTNMLIDFE